MAATADALPHRLQQQWDDAETRLEPADQQCPRCQVQAACMPAPVHPCWSLLKHQHDSPLIRFVTG
jgi:hypothetical protein